MVTCLIRNTFENMQTDIQVNIIKYANQKKIGQSAHVQMISSRGDTERLSKSFKIYEKSSRKKERYMTNITFLKHRESYFQWTCAFCYQNLLFLWVVSFMVSQTPEILDASLTIPSYHGNIKRYLTTALILQKVDQ